MKKKALRVFGNPQNFTGYGNATQAISLAISKSEIPAKYILSGRNKSFVKNLEEHACDPNVDLYIQTPPFSGHRSNNYKIGYFYWEADTLPAMWAKDIKKSLDEIWAPCNLVKQACIKAGFKGPIHILPTPSIPTKGFGEIQIPTKFKDLVLDKSVFKFYSIFQWNERKGYNKLIRSYYEEFDSSDNVILIIKASPIDHPMHGVQKIKDDILKIKSLVRRTKKDLPRIFLITDYLDRSTIDSLHHTCDAFVLPHHGEGWGMPIHDAVNHGNLIITTKYGGITEWLNNDNAFIIDHSIVPVSKMNWNPWYNESQRWANPSSNSLKKQMRICFSNKDKFDYKKENLLAVSELLTIEKCSENIKHIFGRI